MKGPRAVDRKIGTAGLNENAHQICSRKLLQLQQPFILPQKSSHLLLSIIRDYFQKISHGLPCTPYAENRIEGLMVGGLG